MARFKVRAGMHVEAGKVYTKGQIVKSDEDLCKAFPEKFENLDANLAPGDDGQGGIPVRADGARVEKTRVVEADNKVAVQTDQKELQSAKKTLIKGK